MGQRSTRVAWVLAAAAAGGPAAAQSVAFGPPLAGPPAVPPVQVALAPWTAPPALDLFVGEPRGAGVPARASIYRRGDLASVPFPWTDQVAGTCFAAGSWAGPGIPPTAGDGLADLAWCNPPLHLFYQLSPNLPSGWPYLDSLDGVATGLVFARLLDRPDLVLAIGEQQEIELAPAPSDSSFTSHQLYYPAPRIDVAQAAPTFALQPLRLGAVARASGLDDLAWSRVGRPDLFVLWTLSAATQPAVAVWDGRLLTYPGALEVRGAGAVDVDGDGIPDLLAVVVPLAGPGRLLALHNPGTPFPGPTPLLLDAASLVDVGAGLGLVLPEFAAPLDLGGVPAAAVFDDGTAPPRLHVVTANPAGGLLDWSTPTDPRWGEPTQVLAGDLLGSAAADLVVAFGDGTIRVWPGDLPPAIAWAAGSPPAQADTSQPLVVAVDASDPDGLLGPVELRIQGRPSGLAPSQSGSRYTFTVPGAALQGLGCSASLTVRATDDLGAWREVAAGVALLNPPSLALQGAGTAGPVPLLPGGTAAALTAQVADACGHPVSVAWVDGLLPAGASSSTASGPGTSVHTILVPEAAYPAMVAGGAMTLPVTVTATAAGVPTKVDLVLAFDASGLLDAEHRSDRAALAPGEMALLTTTLRSRIGVGLLQVALDDRLAGLVAAGPARVSGAGVVAAADGPGGLSVTLDQVPGGGAPVVVELPVRLGEAGGGSSLVRALAAQSGVPLSPAAEVSAPAAPAAGLSCASGGASPAWLLALLAYMKAMRRVPARTRSTSSRTPISRQA